MKRIISLTSALFIILMLVSCNTLEIQSCLPIYSMDTTIQVTFYNVKDYEVHYKKIKEIYQLYDSISSDYTSNSEENSIYDLNKKRTIAASNELVDLVTLAIQLMEDTQGYYNPLIGRLSHIWKEAIDNKKTVPEEVIQSELKILQETSITIEDHTIILNGQGNVDLGGIAKGYATQKAKEYLDSENIDRFLINAGSSNVVFGHKNDKDFIIALEEPYRNSNIMLVKDTNKAIGTSSGKYQNAIIDDVRYHHLLNPFTGVPSNLYDSVNVMCNDSTLCDVYATAIFSMDLNTAKEFSKNKGIDIILFKDNSILYQSDGWNSYA